MNASTLSSRRVASWNATKRGKTSIISNRILNNLFSLCTFYSEYPKYSLKVRQHVLTLFLSTFLTKEESENKKRSSQMLIFKYRVQRTRYKKKNEKKNTKQAFVHSLGAKNEEKYLKVTQTRGRWRETGRASSGLAHNGVFNDEPDPRCCGA